MNLSITRFLVRVGNSNTVVGVGAGDVLVAGSSSVIPISISIARLSRPLAIRVVDVVAIRSVVVRAALVNKGVATAIAISGLSRPLAISVAAISIATIASGQTLGAPVDRAGATIGMVGNSAIAAIPISRLSLSRPLSISVAAISIATISVSTIVSRKSLGRSVGVASAAIAISRLSLGVSLAIAIDVVAIVVVGGAVAIAMVSLGHIHRGRSIASIAAVAITRLSLGLPLAIAIATIAIALDSLGRSVIVAGGTAIAIPISWLSSSKAGKRENDLE